MKRLALAALAWLIPTLALAAMPPIPPPAPSTYVVRYSNGTGWSAGADTSEDVLLSLTLPANAIGPNGCADLDTIWTMTASTNQKTARIHFYTSPGTTNGTNVLAGVVTTSLAGTHWDVHVCNLNATNSQLAGVAAGVYGNSTAAPTATSIDTTATSYFVITAQKASSGETLTLDQVTFKTWYSN